MTNDLKCRIHEHRQKFITSFTEKYNVNKLVYYEETWDAIATFSRKKQLKWWREKKNGLANQVNTAW